MENQEILRNEVSELKTRQKREIMRMEGQQMEQVSELLNIYVGRYGRLNWPRRKMRTFEGLTSLHEEEKIRLLEKHRDEVLSLQRKISDSLNNKPKEILEHLDAILGSFCRRIEDVRDGVRVDIEED
jgi:hypothetical protein